MSSSTPRVSRLPEATPVSRILRMLLGLALVAWMIPVLQGAEFRHWLQIGGVILGLIALYTLVHLAVSRYFSWVHPGLGALFAVSPALLVSLGGGVYSVGVVLFIGLSLILIAAIGHPGCEVLAFPALMLGRRTHLACILFSPIDWVEGKLRRTR